MTAQICFYKKLYEYLFYDLNILYRSDKYFIRERILISRKEGLS